jgi:hypothetical protein
MTIVNDENYARLARELADMLMHWARDRHSDDKKEIARLQSELCQLRREELRSEPEPH